MGSSSADCPPPRASLRERHSTCPACGCPTSAASAGSTSPNHADTPRVDAPSVEVSRADAPTGSVDIPNPGSIGDNLGNHTPSVGTPSAPEVEVPGQRGDHNPAPQPEALDPVAAARQDAAGTAERPGGHDGDAAPGSQVAEADTVRRPEDTGTPAHDREPALVGTGVGEGSSRDTPGSGASQSPDTVGGDGPSDRAPDTNNSGSGSDTSTGNGPDGAPNSRDDGRSDDIGRHDSSAGDAGDRAHLIAEAQSDGLKLDSDSVIEIGKDPNGRFVWLEEGGVNPRSGKEAGLQHIVNEHADDFARQGIAESEIPRVVHEAATRGEYTGRIQGRPPGRPIFAIEYDGKAKYIAVTIGRNGYIVGANPVGPHSGNIDPNYGQPGHRGW